MIERSSSGTNDVFLAQVEKLAGEVVAREGCELYDVEFGTSSGQRVLRVYIDKGTEPVGIDDCANVSRGLNLLLDDEDLVPGGNYQLEVSSPGLDRVLRRVDHFQKAIGKKVWLRLDRALQELGVDQKGLLNAKQVQGTLLEVLEDGVRIDFAEKKDDAGVEKVVKIPWQAVQKAKTVFDFSAVDKSMRKGK